MQASAPHGQKIAIAVNPTWNRWIIIPAPILLSTCTIDSNRWCTSCSVHAASQPAFNIIFPTVYSYDTVNHVYVAHFIGNPIEPNPVLSPYIGYWLAAKASCTINVTPPAGFYEPVYRCPFRLADSAPFP